MAMPPGLGGDIPDGDRKRLMQRADTFAIGTGTRESKDRDDVKDFDEELDTALRPRNAKSVDEDVEKQVKDTEEYRKSQLLDEAERRGSGSPSLNAYPGLLALPGVGVPMMQIGDTPRSESKGRSGGVESAGEKIVATVSQEVLQGLREAGLADPVATLDDPRLGKAADRLSESFTLGLSGHDRVYVWSLNGCHQILTIGMHETKVESAAGTSVETLRRQGTSDEKTVVSRPAPDTVFPTLPEA